MQALSEIKQHQHRYILNVIYFEVRRSRSLPNEEELVLVTELITAGSIRE